MTQGTSDKDRQVGTSSERRYPASATDVAQVISAVFIRVPIGVFVGSVEICARAMRQLERMVGLGIDSMLIGSDESTPADPSAVTGNPRLADTALRANAAAIFQEEQQEVSMTDTNLSDDMVKVVEYDIVSVKRDDERFVYRGKEVLTDNMNSESFGAWVISKYLDSDKYKNDILKHPTHEINAKDKKFLRVNYAVQARWPREEPEYDKNQVEVLKKQNELAEKQNELIADQTRVLSNSLDHLARAKRARRP